MDPNDMKARKKAVDAPVDRYAFMKTPARSQEARVFDVNRLDPNTLLAAVAAVTATGDMISFTLTSDGGALCISVVSNGQRLKQYAPDRDQAHDILEALSLVK